MNWASFLPNPVGYLPPPPGYLILKDGPHWIITHPSTNNFVCSTGFTRNRCYYRNKKAALDVAWAVYRRHVGD